MQEGSNENTAYWTRQNCWKLGKKHLNNIWSGNAAVDRIFFPNTARTNEPRSQYYEYGLHK